MTAEQDKAIRAILQRFTTGEQYHDAYDAIAAVINEAVQAACEERDSLILTLQGERDIAVQAERARAEKAEQEFKWLEEMTGELCDQVIAEERRACAEIARNISPLAKHWPEKIAEAIEARKD